MKVIQRNMFDRATYWLKVKIVLLLVKRINKQEKLGLFIGEMRYIATSYCECGYLCYSSLRKIVIGSASSNVPIVRRKSKLT